MKIYLLFLLAFPYSLATPVKFEERNDITSAVNNALQDYLSTLDDPVLLSPHINYPIDVALIADVLITMDNAELRGVHSIYAENFQTNISLAVEGHIKVPQLELFTPKYTMNGSVVDHIPLQGEGPATITIDELDIAIVGKYKLLPQPQFTEISVDFEMFQFTVNFEDLAPGTDLGEIFNQFFSMSGPEIFDLLEIQLNEGDWLLNFVNGILGVSSKKLRRD